MELSVLQKKEILERGFVKVPGVIPNVMVDAAMQAINHSFGEGMDPEKLNQFRSRSYCPELQGEPVIRDLINATPAWSLAESAIGAGKIKPVSRGQIAVRFPTMADPPPPVGGHLDGRYSPHNGVPQGEIHNFTMLLGVALSDVQHEWAGNLTVWPGSHHLYEAYFREHGFEILRVAGPEGMPKIEEPAPEQQLARAGDVFLVHYLIKHGVATNVSPLPRYAIYFRLSHVDHETMRFDSLTDLWLEWEGMKGVVEESGRGGVGV